MPNLVMGKKVAKWRLSHTQPLTLPKKKKKIFRCTDLEAVTRVTRVTARGLSPPLEVLEFY